MSNLSEGHPLATAPRSQRYVIVKIQPRAMTTSTKYFCEDSFISHERPRQNFSYDIGTKLSRRKMKIKK